MSNLTYNELYSLLSNNIVFLIFYKKDGNVRVMLSTKNEGIALLANNLSPIPSRYIRESKESGNISVIDLELKERRSFNIDRLVSVYSFGNISTEAQYTNIYNQYIQYKKKYLEELAKTATQLEESTFNVPFENKN